MATTPTDNVPHPTFHTHAVLRPMVQSRVCVLRKHAGFKPHRACGRPLSVLLVYRILGAAYARVGVYLFLQPPRWVPSVVADMLRLCCPQQRFSKKAECAWASASAVSRPNLPFCLSVPHFVVPQLDSSCICGRQSAFSIALLRVHVWHFTRSAHITHWHTFRPCVGCTMQPRSLPCLVHSLSQLPHTETPTDASSHIIHPHPALDASQSPNNPTNDGI